MENYKTDDIVAVLSTPKMFVVYTSVYHFPDCFKAFSSAIR
jgi:hypothetical protein